MGVRSGDLDCSGPAGLNHYVFFSPAAFFLSFFFNILKQVPIYFSCFGECCNTLFCREVPEIFYGPGGVDND